MLSSNAVSIYAIRTALNTLQAEITALKRDVTAARTDITALRGLPEGITFVFAGSPVAGSLIVLPLVYDLSIPVNLAGSMYYNVTNPLVASTFTLARIAANGTVTPVSTITVSTAGAGSFAGPATVFNAAAGERLRMTATTIGGSLANVGISIRVTRR